MKTRLSVVLVTTAIVLGGCLFTGTFSIRVHLENLVADFSAGYLEQTVDLALLDDTWDEHSDDIERIEAIFLDAIVTNDTNEPDTLGVYIAEASSLPAADIPTVARPLLTGYVVPAQATDILTVVEAQQLWHSDQANLEAVKNLVKTGMFSIYVTSSTASASVTLDEMNLYVTFTAR